MRDTARVIVENLDGHGLSSREREVFWLVAERLRNREIAERLHIGVRTVESHVSTILRKIGGEQRDDIVELAAGLTRRRVVGTPPPVPLSSFVGRETDVAALIRSVSAHRLVTLVGPPGVGKTRLAFHVARTASDMPPPVVVDLATTAAEGEVLRAFTSALGLAEAHRSLRRSLHDALEVTPTWLIVDNCEHVEDAAAALIAEVLTTHGATRVLATSRSPLAVGGEVVVEVQPLDLPEPDEDPRTRLDAPACRLFLERATAGDIDGAAVEAPAIAELCRRLDGLPLAIELAAAQTRWSSPAEILDQLDGELLALEARRSDLPDRHRTVAAAVQWSYDLLSADEQCLLQRCSIFPGEFELDVLVDVAACTELAPSDVVRLLPRLVDRSLLSVRRRNEHTTSYRMLDSVRAFARARLIEAGERDRMQERHARAHLERAAAVGGELIGPHQAAAVSWFDRRWRDLSAAMGWVTARQEIELAWTFLTTIGRRWLVVGPRGEILDWIGRLLDHPLPDGRLGVDARLTAAHLLCFQDTRLAFALVSEAQSSIDAADRHTVALAELTMGKTLAFLSRGEEAVAPLQRAVTALRSLGDPWHEALALQALGHVGTTVDAACNAYRRSARKFRELHDDVMLANTLTLMTTRALSVDVDVPDIDEWLAEARALAERTGSQWERAHVDLDEATLVARRDPRRADAGEFERLLSVFSQMGDNRCASRCRLALGEIAMAGGANEEAVVHLRAAATTAQRMSFPLVVAAALRRLAAVEERTGDLDQAARLLGRADAAARLLDPPRRAGLPETAALRAGLEDRLGDGYADVLHAGEAMAPELPW